MTPRNEHERRPSQNHVVISGPTGTGKSVTMLSLNAALMRLPLSRRPAMLWIDLHGATVTAAAKWAAKWGVIPRAIDGQPLFIWDEGAATSGVPGSRIVTSVNPDLQQQIAENRVGVEELITLVRSLEGQLNADQAPVTLDGMTAGGNLLVWQDQTLPPKSPAALQHCYRMTEQFRAFERNLRGPKRDEILRTFDRYHNLDERQWEYLCGPAVRRWRRLGESPQFAARYDRPNAIDKVSFFNRGGIWMYSGESRGNLSRADNTLLASSLHQEAIQIARSGLLTRDLIICFDEPVHGGSGSLLNLQFVRNLAECRKWRVSYGGIAIQNPLSYDDPRIGEELFGNCKTWFVHKQTNPRACDFFAEGFFQSHFDALEVHFVEERTRYEDDEPEKMATESENITYDEHGNKRTEGKTHGFVYRTVRRPVIDKIVHHKSPEVKRSEIKSVIANMRTGQAMVRDGDAVTREPVNIPMMGDPWPDLWFSRHPRIALSDEKLRLAVERLRKRPEYQASFGATPCPPTTPPASTDAAASRLDAGEL